MTDTSIIEERGSAVVEMAKGIEITDAETYQQAIDFVRERINPFLKEVDATFDPQIATAWKLHKDLKAEKERHRGPGAQAKTITGNKAAKWKAEDDRKRREAEEKRRAEQRRIQQEEEEARRVEEQRKKAAAEKLRLAQEAEEAGKTEEAEKILDQVPLAPEAPAPRPTPAPSTYVPPPVKATGASTRKNWSAKVVNMRDLCKAIAEGLVPPDYVEGNMTVLNALARKNKESFDIPGVEAVAKDNMSFR